MKMPIQTHIPIESNDSSNFLFLKKLFEEEIIIYELYVVDTNQDKIGELELIEHGKHRLLELLKHGHKISSITFKFYEFDSYIRIMDNRVKFSTKQTDEFLSIVNKLNSLL